jgi:hypothetical protein
LVGNYLTPIADEIELNTVEICVPRMVRTIMITMAINTRINAYSTIPWPFSFGENNMTFHLLFYKITLVYFPKVINIIDKIFNKCNSYLHPFPITYANTAIFAAGIWSDMCEPWPGIL